MLLQGILLGLSLSFLVGPLLFAIVEAGIGQGFRAGISVAAGIWASDVLYVLVALFGIDSMEALVALPHFKMWAGLVGGLLLAGFGAASIWKASSQTPKPENLKNFKPSNRKTAKPQNLKPKISPPDLQSSTHPPPSSSLRRVNTPQTSLPAEALAKEGEPSNPKPYLWWWLRGFLLNTINPGTVFFWLGIVSAVVVPSGWSRGEMLVFFGGMLTTLVVTDITKAWAAKRLRRFLTPAHTRQLQRGLGILMIVFGLVLIARAIIF